MIGQDSKTLNDWNHEALWKNRFPSVNPYFNPRSDGVQID